jgi:formylglycine-generating enzyme required for sulfatase activity
MRMAGKNQIGTWRTVCFAFAAGLLVLFGVVVGCWPSPHRPPTGEGVATGKEGKVSTEAPAGNASDSRSETSAEAPADSKSDKTSTEAPAGSKSDSQSEPPPGAQTWKNPKDGSEMVLIPAGEFLMGTSEEWVTTQLIDHPDLSKETFENEQPQHTVYVDAYWIDRYEVTNAQYRKFVEEIFRTNDHSRCHPDEPKDQDHRPKWG